MEWEAPWWDDWTGGGIANMISKVFKVAKNHTLALRDRANTPAPAEPAQSLSHPWP